jgi:23S rRNA pseudouridine2605 synthase
MKKKKKKKTNSKFSGFQQRKKHSTNTRIKKNVGTQKAPPPAVEEIMELPAEGMVLNKYVALSGICSRRKAVELIEKGEVKVNGEVATKPYHRVMQGDAVTHLGKSVSPEVHKQYILLNKPKNCITSLSDPEGRKTVIDAVTGACKERIFPVGRLDRNTTGLLLLTNDGELAKKLSHPSHIVKKLYYATLDKPISEEEINQILAGLELEDGKAEVDACGFIENSKGLEVGIEIHIGRNRIVRRIFEHLGYEVKRLDRMLYAGLTKKDLPRGRWRHLTSREIIMLQHFS